MRELNKDESIEVGDFIIASHALGKSKWPITRVTKTMAISSRWRGPDFAKDDFVTCRFPRVYGFGFQSVPRQEWNTVNYIAYTNRE